MNDLTEKWKKKELKWHKSYYCKNKKGEIVVATIIGDDLYSTELWGTLNFGYWEVLAECNYEELQELKSKRDKLAYDLGVADTKNGELLRLLKECKRLLKEYNYTFPTNDFEKSDKLLTKINEVLK